MQSENIAELAKALCAAQAEMKGAAKDAENPFFKSKYADLESVWEACRGPLTKHGLSVSQTTDFENGITYVQTNLLHISGQFIAGRLPLIAMKQDPQSIGAALTYYRRFCLSAIVGIIQVDDDGETASGRTNPPAPVDKLSLVTSEFPMCCGQKMNVSKYNPNELYCFKCKKKQKINPDNSKQSNEPPPPNDGDFPF